MLEELLIKLGLDTKDAKIELGELKNGFNELLKIGGSIAGLFSLSSMVNNFVETNKRLNTLSENLGENCRDIQAWGGAVESLGGNTSAFEGSLTSLNNALQQMAINGNASVLPVLNKLGVGVKNSYGEFKKGTELLKDLSLVFENMSGGEASTYGKMLGLDDGTINILKLGNKEINELLKRQEKLGLYSEEDSKLAISFSNSLRELKQSLQSIVAVFVRLVLPIMKKFNEVLLNISLFIRKYENFIKVFFVSLAGIFALRLIPAVLGIAKAFIGFKNSTGWLVLLASVIAILIDDFMIWKKGGDACLGSLYEWMEKNKVAVGALAIAVGGLMGAFTIGKVLSFSKAIKDMVVSTNNTLGGSKIFTLLSMVSAGYKIGEFAIEKIQNAIDKDLERLGKGYDMNKETQILLNSPERLRKQRERAKNNINNSVSINKIEVKTQATNAQGISQGIGESLGDVLGGTLVNLNNGF